MTDDHANAIARLRATTDPATEPDAAWWPAGCTIGDVAPPDCDACAALLARLAHDRAVAAGAAPATPAGDASLQAFAGGERE